ncbi:hypothetical protein ACJZ2D_004564 [Fusarium nematophilum]
MVNDVNDCIGQRENQDSSTRWYMQKHLKTPLEAFDEDFTQGGQSCEGIERATALLRQMYAIDLEVWAIFDGPQRTAAEQQRLKIRSTTILGEVNRLVNMWAAAVNDSLMNDPSMISVDDTEMDGMNAIVQGLADFRPFRYPDVN